MAQNFGPGIQGGVVLIDPTTGEPYRASGGGGGGASNAVLSDTTAAYSYMGVAPSGTAVEDDWYITRIPLNNPNAPLHATGAWTDRTTLIYS